MEISYVEPLSRAVERMRGVLFQPFDLVKWLVLGFSAWLAGLATRSGGGTGWQGSDWNEFDSPREVASDVGEALERLVEHVFLVPLALLLLTAVLVLILVLLWISSRGKFIFLDNVVHDRAEIVEPWKRFRKIGNSLFLWRFGFAVACIVVVLVVMVVIFAPAATLSFSDALRGLSFAAMFFGVLTVSVLGVLAAFVLLLLENFIIPIMYRFDLNATEAWRVFLPWLRARTIWFILYGLFVLLAAIPAIIAFGVLCCCTCCIVALPYIGDVILLPIWVTYRVLGPEFLAQLDPSFDLFGGGEAEPAAVAGPSEEP
jgi:hypothetical protein